MYKTIAIETIMSNLVGSGFHTSANIIWIGVFSTITKLKHFKPDLTSLQPLKNTYFFFSVFDPGPFANPQVVTRRFHAWRPSALDTGGLASAPHGRGLLRPRRCGKLRCLDFRRFFSPFCLSCQGFKIRANCKYEFRYDDFSGHLCKGIYDQLDGL